MPSRNKPAQSSTLESIPALPIPRKHWQAIVEALDLSEQQARVLELVLCDFADKEIAAALGLGLGTVKNYLARIARKTGAKGRMQLAMHVLVLSHEVKWR